MVFSLNKDNTHQYLGIFFDLTSHHVRYKKIPYSQGRMVSAFSAGNAPIFYPSKSGMKSAHFNNPRILESSGAIKLGRR